MTLAQAKLEIGASIGGYDIVDELGRGSFGAVYLARQLKLEREVAIKVIDADRTEEAEDLARRFLREVDLVRRLEHPNIVRLYDFGETDDGQLWMAMELVRGEELATVLEKGPLEPARAHQITLQILDALTEAHSLGIIHRDLKPGNIMLTQKGAQSDVVKLLDFGVGKALGDSENPALQNLTAKGEGGYGTPRYMAPEYLKGEPIGTFTDVYAVGLILYEMLVGEPAVVGDRVLEILSRQLTRPLALPAWLHGSRLGLAISRASAKASRLRYPTALEFFRDIENIPREELRRIADARAGRLPSTDVRLQTGPSDAPPVPIIGDDAAQPMLDVSPPGLTDSEPVRGAPPPLPLPVSARETITSLDPELVRLSRPSIETSSLDDDIRELRGARPSLPVMLGVAAVALVLIVVVVALISGGDEDDSPGNAEAATEPTDPHGGADESTDETTSDADSTARVVDDHEPTEPAASAAGEDTGATDLAADGAPNGETVDGETVPPTDPVDAAPVDVQISVASTPVGASVYNGRELLCAETPCQIALAADVGETRLKFKLDGYRTGSASVDPATETSVSVSLRARSSESNSSSGDSGGNSNSGNSGGGLSGIKIP